MDNIEIKIDDNYEFKQPIYKDDNQIFKYLDPDHNDMLSMMKGADLQDLIILLDDYYLYLRNKLGFTKDITFGVEIEFENANRKKIDKKLMEIFSDDKWFTKYDSSLRKGAEINSPILRDKESDWQNLNMVCELVKPHAIIGNNSGGHIHIGSQILGDDIDAWLNFIKLWSVYENVIFRFTYGNFLGARPKIFHYATPIAKNLWKDYTTLRKWQKYDESLQASLTIEDIIDAVADKRNQAINFGNVDYDECDSFEENNTIEFRCPNGSLESPIWQNNINLFVNLLCYAKSSTFDDDILNKRHAIIKNNYDLFEFYNEIFLDQALELSDMIFKSNLDKVAFLKQYLKSFQVESRSAYPKKCILTKRRIS